MKKWIFAFVTLLLIGYFGYQILPNYSDIAKDIVDKGIIEFKQYKQPTLISIENVEKEMIKVTTEQIYKGDLLLINHEHPIRPQNEAQDIVRLGDYSEFSNRFVLLDRSTMLSLRVAESFASMVEVAQEDGVGSFMISSGYRNEQEQNELYEKKGADYAMPAGYSEHNFGLALDVGSTQGGIEHSSEGKWLRDNAWKYGFILRYPKDKLDITGIQFEPWHYRYVGLPHSVIMEENDMVLEEYFDFLKEQQSISTTIAGQKYDVYYYPISQDQEIPVPVNYPYTISGDNMDGIIITQRYE